MNHDSNMPEAQACVLGPLLERWATEKPEEIAVLFEDGTSCAWVELLKLTRRVARGLSDMGIRRGDHVLSWQPNGREALLTWFGLNYLGAVYVPVNTAYKGMLLQHVVQLSDASHIICHSGLAPLLEDIDYGPLLTDIVLTGAVLEVSGLSGHCFTDLMDNSGEIEPADLQPWDTAYIIYTSGTTGPSKAVLSSYLHAYSSIAETHAGFSEADRILVNLPLFHCGGTTFIYLSLIHGASFLLVESFKTDKFWSVVRNNEVTYCCLLGAMTTFLRRAPPSNQDREHPIRMMISIPWNEDSLAVSLRYGIEMRTVYNMTEISSPLASDINPPAMGTCGRPRAGVEVRVVDENDCEVAPGQVGELIVRTDLPWAMNHGYYKNPEATAAAWHNGWFHTGDAFRCDDEGNFYFVDRIKDAIRRRGENISSFEVESEVTAHECVREAAAIGIPSEFSEDEVMVVVSPAGGKLVEAEELFRFLEPRMAHFMLPRYIRVMDELPKTPTQKILKHELKTAGLTPDTWDREDKGIKVRRQELS
ncbi:MAG: AMP-binding protein [Pseudomonadales bacterium]|jgi:crotonobetaine/carnitine-CoA ligase|nr:AMP-binding protein [Pseudomonadales bacterium]MDP6829003.1 AMP-binding protein [Pseudomonadales bacterium]|tara:strand:- start:251 stop:1849 length:1599 start_codon:yes stop_codon:yes gene_type:complete